MSFSIHQTGEGTSSKGLEATFLDPPSHDFWPQALWECWLQLQAELWHQQALPGEMPAIGGAAPISWSSALSSLRAGLGRAGPWPQHLQNPEAQAISALPCRPRPSSGFLGPSLSSPPRFQYGDHPETIYCSCC